MKPLKGIFDELKAELLPGMVNPAALIRESIIYDSAEAERKFPMDGTGALLGKASMDIEPKNVLGKFHDDMALPGAPDELDLFQMK